MLQIKSCMLLPCLLCTSTMYTSMYTYVYTILYIYM